MAGLPREVIKWLQSLDLSYPVKNPKRDFANGYLIAEIFSRYFPSDLYVSTFYNGTSSAQKLNNWGQLEKFFKKTNIIIPKEAMEAVMNHTGDSAILFVQNIYVLLTNRKAPWTTPIEQPSKPSENTIVVPSCHVQDPVPHFALPTTSNLIRCAASTPAKAKAVVQAHNEFLKQLRTQRTQPQEPNATETQQHLAAAHPESTSPKLNKKPTSSARRAGSKPVTSAGKIKDAKGDVKPDETIKYITVKQALVV